MFRYWIIWSLALAFDTTKALTWCLLIIFFSNKDEMCWVLSVTEVQQNSVGSSEFVL